MHRITGDRYLCLLFPGLFTAYPALSFSVTCRTDELGGSLTCFLSLSLLLLNYLIEFGRVKSTLLQEAGILISLVPSNIINTLDNAPSFLVDSSSVSSVFDQQNAPADKITPEIEILNPGKILVHFTLSPERGCCHRTCLHSADPPSHWSERIISGL